MRWGLTVLAGSVLAVSGCGQGEPPTANTVTVTATPTSSQPTTAAPTPSPTAWSKAEAGQKYLAMIKASNAANIELARISGPDNATVEDMAAQCRKVADAEYELIAAMRKGAWPEDAKADIEAMIEATKKDAAGNEKCAAAKSIPAVEAGFIMSQESGTTGASAVVRAALGLPRP